MDQELEVCPLCGLGPVKFMAMNLTEKLLMCANTQCDFPFGYEELKIITAEGNEKETSGVEGSNSQLSTSAQCHKSKEKTTVSTSNAATASTSTATKTKSKKNKGQKAAKMNKMNKNLDELRKITEEIHQHNNEECSIQNKD